MLWKLPLHSNSTPETLTTVGTPIHFSETPLHTEAVAHTAPPLLGEHTQSILHEVLGMSSSDIKHLVDNNVVKLVS